MEQDFDTSPAHSAPSTPEKADGRLTRVPQGEIEFPDSSHEQQLNYNHPSAFSFPTLEPDGSLSDLRELSPRRYAPTPPAALSTLGIKARMAEHADVESLSSFADSSYDMVEDASDIETASLPSDDHYEGEERDFTPEGSVTDMQEEDERSAETRNMTSAQVLPSIPSSSSTTQAAENELLDSYMTEDIETPRQSTLHETIPGPSPRRLPLLSSSTTLNPFLDKTKKKIRVLFCAERNVPGAVMERVCSRIASSLTASQGSKSYCEVVRLPPTPTGINPSSAMVVQNDQVELIVQECVGADSRHAQSHALHIMDADRETASLFTVGPGGKIDLEMPDLVVFYVDRPNKYYAWFDKVKHAMLGPLVPNMTIGAPGVDFDLFDKDDQELLDDSDIVISNSDLYDGEIEDLRADLDLVLSKPQLQTMRDKRTRTSTIKKFKKTDGCKDFKKRFFSAGLVLLSILIFLNFVSPMLSPKPPPNPAAELAVRRDALSTAFYQFSESSEAAKALNLDHLLPSWMNVNSSKSDATVQFQGINPNHVVVSPQKHMSHRGYPKAVSTRVYSADGQAIAFNLTRLIDGVYVVSVAPEDAHGRVTVNMLLKSPQCNVTLTHNFGLRMWQRQTYQKASTDLSKVANKEVAIMTNRVRSLKERFGLEFVAGATATKNVTSQVAVYMARDLQIFANTAVSVLGKAAAASNETAAALKKELISTRKDLVKLSHDLQKSMMSTAKSAKALMPTKKTLRDPLVASRKKALGLRDMLAGRPKDVNSTSATKELSLRLQNIFKPTEKSEKASSLSNIARCLPEKNYCACRKAQRAAALDKTEKSLSKMVEKHVIDMKKHKAKVEKDAEGLISKTAAFKDSTKFKNGCNKSCRKAAKKEARKMQ